LPHDDQNNRDNPSGIRIGFQDVTRRGFKESDIKYLCDLMLAVIKGKRKLAEVKEEVVAFKKQFNKVEYGFNSIEEAIRYLRAKHPR